MSLALILVTSPRGVALGGDDTARIGGDCNQNGVSDDRDVAFRPAREYAVELGGATAESLSAADLDGDEILDLIVAAGTDVRLLLNDGTGSFALYAQIRFGVDNPGPAVTGDLDGDGDVDVAVAFGFGNSCTMRVLRNDGAGGVVVVSSCVPGLVTEAPAISDVDTDGDLDLIVATSDGVALLRNEGDASFSAAELLAPNTRGSLLADDLDGDGALDVAVVNLAFARVLLNRGDGTFSAQPDGDVALGLTFAEETARSTKTSRRSMMPRPIPLAEEVSLPIAAGDFDADGDVDLAVTSGGGPLSGVMRRAVVLVLRNNGSGNLTAGQEYELSGAAHGIAVQDMDNDGHPDVIVAGDYSGKVHVLRNGGDGTFREPVSFLVGPTVGGLAEPSPRFVVAGDWDGDGHPDLATANDLPFGISVLLSRASETFSGDCNGNGVPDECESDWDANGLIDACDPGPFTCGPGPCAQGALGVIPLLSPWLWFMKQRYRRRRISRSPSRTMPQQPK